MYFKDIIGHKKTIENLINTVNSGRISHAYIFYGPEGVGKFKTAETFAAALLCNEFDGELCGKCKNCHMSFASSNPDLIASDYSVGSDGKEKNSVSVESMREFKNDVYLKPFGGKRKIYIIDKAEKMTPVAQNALLKILEEPPEYITVILVCSNISKILPTVISRTVQIKFSYLSPEDIEIYLNKYYNNIENKKIHSRICGGSISTVRKNIEDPESLAFRKQVIDGMRDLCLSPLETSVNSLLGIFLNNKDKWNTVTGYLAVFAYDCILSKTEQYSKTVNADVVDDIKKICRNVTAGNIFNIQRIIEQLNKRIVSNSNYKLAVTDALLRIREEIHG